MKKNSRVILSLVIALVVLLYSIVTYRADAVVTIVLLLCAVGYAVMPAIKEGID